MKSVIWVEESKKCLGFEILPNYDNVLMRSQRLTDRQSSCIQIIKDPILVTWGSSAVPSNKNFKCLQKVKVII